MIAALKTLDGLDREFAEFLGQRATPATRESVKLAAALLSVAVRQGHVCLPLADPIIGEDPPELQLPSPPDWRKALLNSGIATEPGGFAPLVLDPANRLYLKRYYDYENALAERLRERLAAPERLLWTEGMNVYFGTEPGINWQKIAAFSALHHRFCVITGGPGTGKTWTTVRILGLLVEVNPAMRLALTAPTGRAAARLTESIMAARASLPEAVASRIPTEAGTIHRLLGTIPGSPRFHFDRANPLPFDTVVVDEASMVDLPLMAKLTAALPAASRLILVGDSDQLSSVQAGNVLADLCVRRNFFSPGFAALAGSAGIELPAPGESVQAEANSLSNSIVELRANQRFDSGGSIQRFCESTRLGDTSTSLTISVDPSSKLCLREIKKEADLDALLRQYITAFVVPRFAADNVRDSLALFARSRLLCAHRAGSRGVEGVNRHVERILAEAGNISFAGASYYPGRPLMVTVNDYHQGLFNGDTGLIVREEEPGQGERAVFGLEGGDLRFFHPAQLPAHETAYATSVHKSQGSEFENVVLILPEKPSRVLSRELIYTAASRARKGVEIWGSATVLEAAILRQVKRFSGLSERLS